MTVESEEMSNQQTFDSTDEELKYEILDIPPLPPSHIDLQKVEVSGCYKSVEAASRLLGCTSVTRDSQFKQLLTYAIGIFCFYMLYGIVQEEM